MATRCLLHPESRTFSSAGASGGAFGGFIFNMRKEEQTLYQVLDIPSSSNQKQVKLAYYKMAKKYHPDFQFDLSDKEKAEAEIQFKII